MVMGQCLSSYTQNIRETLNAKTKVQLLIEKSVVVQQKPTLPDLNLLTDHLLENLRNFKC